MKRTYCAILLAAATVSFIACDDDDDNKSVNDNDKSFSEMAARANITEVQFGQLAQTNGSDDMVIAFADQMVDEHTNARNELETITDKMSNVDWPDGLDAKHQQIYDQLMTMSGFAFDSAYIASQVMDHQKADSLFEAGMTKTSNADLKAYATKYRPHIQEHLRMADSIRTVLMNNHSMNNN